MKSFLRRLFGKADDPVFSRGGNIRPVFEPRNGAFCGREFIPLGNGESIAFVPPSSRIHPCYLPAQWHCVLKPCEVSGRVDFALRLDSGHVQCLSLTRENAEVFVKTFEDCLYGKFTVSFTPEGLPLVSVSKWREEGNVIKPDGDQAAVLSEPESRTHPSYRPARWRCVLKPCEVSGRIAFSFTLDSGQAQRFSLTIGNAEVFVKMLQDCLNGYLSISHSDKSYGISSEEVSTPQESESVAPMFKSPAAPSRSS